MGWHLRIDYEQALINGPPLMELIVPSRNSPTSGSFPTAPKKVRQWLSGLYPVTSNSSTQTLIRGLKHCNRLENSVRNRVETLAYFRPVVRELIESLSARYAGQNLPLAEREYNSFSMVMTLLQEMAFGYKIVVSDSESSSPTSNNKFRDQALVMALDVLHEIGLRHLQVYQDIPDNIWHDCNTLFQIAESRKFSKRELGKDTSTRHNPQNIEQMFISLHLLHLAGSHSLRRGQILQLANFINQHAAEVKLAVAEASSPRKTLMYGVDLACAAPAGALSFLDVSSCDTLRSLDLHDFVDLLSSEINNTPNSVSALYESDVLTRESLSRLKKISGIQTSRKTFFTSILP